MQGSFFGRPATRRRFLAGALTAAGLTGLRCVSIGDTGDAVGIERSARRSVAEENALEGADWGIARPALRGEIAGYCGQVSVQPGDRVDVHVSTARDGAAYVAEVFRMGWYSGAGARLMRTFGGLKGTAQGTWDGERGLVDCGSCRVDPDTLLIEAGWSQSFTFEVPDDWLSGVYLVRLTETDGGTASYAIFVLRNDASRAPIVAQLSTNTWQAYNTWGDASTYGSFGADRQYVKKRRRAYRVSYDRPYDVALQGGRNYGAGEFLTWEYNFVRWAERSGFELSYVTNVDVELQPGILRKRRLFISLGHDEYWTAGQRAGAEAARDAGVNLAFLSGNEAYWQCRIEPSSDGVPARTLTVYKDADLDPLAREHPRDATVLFADTLVGKPQSELTGLAYGSNATPAYQPWRAAGTDSWVYEGAGIADGEAFPGIVGYEYDSMALPEYRPAGLTVLGRSPVHGFLGADTSISSLYEAASGARVFAAGTIAWSWGLDDWGHEDEGAFADERLQRMTTNILRRLSE